MKKFKPQIIKGPLADIIGAYQDILTSLDETMQDFANEGIVMTVTFGPFKITAKEVKILFKADIEVPVLLQITETQSSETVISKK